MIAIVKEMKEIEVIELPPLETAADVLKKGDLCWLETPRNPTCEVCDITAYSALAAVAVDATFAP